MTDPTSSIQLERLSSVSLTVGLHRRVHLKIHTAVIDRPEWIRRDDQIVCQHPLGPQIPAGTTGIADIGMESHAAPPETRTRRILRTPEQKGCLIAMVIGTAIGRVIRQATAARKHGQILRIRAALASMTRITDVSTLSSPLSTPVRRLHRLAHVVAAGPSPADSALQMVLRHRRQQLLLRGQTDDLLETSRVGTTAPTVRRQQDPHRRGRGGDMTALTTASTLRPLRPLQRRLGFIQTVFDTSILHWPRRQQPAASLTAQVCLQDLLHP